MADLPWIVDCVTGWLGSPLWVTPIGTFIDNNCVIFDTEEEHKLEYTIVHMKFKELVETLLETFLADLEITPDQFATVMSMDFTIEERATLEAAAEIIAAADDYLLFRAIMTQKNLELEAEVMRQIEAMATSPPAYTEVDTSPMLSASLMPPMNAPLLYDASDASASQQHDMSGIASSRVLDVDDDVTIGIPVIEDVHRSENDEIDELMEEALRLSKEEYDREQAERENEERIFQMVLEQSRLEWEALQRRLKEQEEARRRAMEASLKIAPKLVPIKPPKGKSSRGRNGRKIDVFARKGNANPITVASSAKASNGKASASADSAASASTSTLSAASTPTTHPSSTQSAPGASSEPPTAVSSATSAAGASSKPPAAASSVTSAPSATASSGETSADSTISADSKSTDHGSLASSTTSAAGAASAATSTSSAPSASSAVLDESPMASSVGASSLTTSAQASMASSSDSAPKSRASVVSSTPSPMSSSSAVTSARSNGVRSSTNSSQSASPSASSSAVASSAVSPSTAAGNKGLRASSLSPRESSAEAPPTELPPLRLSHSIQVATATPWIIESALNDSTLSSRSTSVDSSEPTRAPTARPAASADAAAPRSPQPPPGVSPAAVDARKRYFLEHRDKLRQQRNQGRMAALQEYTSNESSISRIARPEEASSETRVKPKKSRVKKSGIRNEAPASTGELYRKALSTRLMQELNKKK